MATLTRGLVSVEVVDILGWSLTRPGRSVVHVIVGDPEPDVTGREPGLRSGDVKALCETHGQAQAVAEALAVPGGPWLLDAGVLTMTARVVGDITVEAASDSGGAWFCTFGVQEVTS